MENSKEIIDFAKAMSKFQGEITGAQKGATNPFYQKSYADLGNCWDAIRGPLSENGLSIIQLPEGADSSEVKLTTIILHEAGHSMQSTMVMKPSKNDPQSIGICLTYMRRYMLAAITGLVQEDKDAEGVSSKSNNVKQSSEKQQNLIAGLLTKKKIPFTEFGDKFKVDRLSDLSSKVASEGIDWLQNETIRPEDKKVTEQAATSAKAPVKAADYQEDVPY